jgi:hypothetical protein
MSSFSIKSFTTKNQFDVGLSMCCLKNGAKGVGDTGATGAKGDQGQEG